MSCLGWIEHKKKKKCPRKVLRVIPEVRYYRVGTSSGQVPPDVFALKITLIGPGGSGGWATNAPGGSFATRGGGGGAGAFLQTLLPVTPGQTYTVVVGAGGFAPATLVPGVGTPGTNGTADTTFVLGTVTLVAGLGQGGAGGTGLLNAGGVGGVASPTSLGSTPILAINGQDGEAGGPASDTYIGQAEATISIAQGGQGGNSPLGSSGGFPAHVFALQLSVTFQSIAGTSGILPGGGGGGGEWKIIDSESNTATVGPGPGADGLAIIEFIPTVIA